MAHGVKEDPAVGKAGARERESERECNSSILKILIFFVWID